MIKFAKDIDLENEEAVLQYLKEHDLYWLANSWNRLYTFSNNVKIYNLDVDKETTDKLFELLDMDSIETQTIFDNIVEAFQENNFGYSIGFNGRSNGYMILVPNQDKNEHLQDMIDALKHCKNIEDLKEDYEFEEFKDLEKVVMSFDEACDEYIQEVIDIAKSCEIVEEEYTVTKTRKVLKFPGEDRENEDE